MAQIKKVEEFKKANNKKSWKFTMDDGTQGYSHPENIERPWEYKEGEVVDVKVENKGTYNLLRFTRSSGTVQSQSPQPPAPPQEQSTDKQNEILLPRTRGISTAKSIGEMKFEARVYCLKLAVKCLLAKAIDYPQVKQYYTEWVELIDASIDEIKG
jgi:hypothetical protein